MLTTIRDGERGQTMPFWVMSILVALTLTFFLANYANTVKYQIHAQNAADSAATAALGKDAAALNSTETLLAAFGIQEARTRNVVSAIPFVLGTNPCGPTNLLSPTCTSALQGAATDLASATSSLGNVADTLNNFQTQLAGRLTDTLANPNATVSTLFAPNASNGCSVAVLTDCDFKYTTYLTYDGTTGLPSVDEYACKKVTNTAYAFLRLPMPGTFYAIGHTSATLAPVSATYSPSTLGNAFASTTSVFPSVTGSALLGDLSGLNVNSAFFAATGTKATGPSHTATEVCPA